MKIKILPLKDINFQDERFRISYYFSLEKLSLSIKEIGLIQPPLVSVLDKQFVLVTGWKRVLACRQLGLSALPCWIVTGSNPLRLFLMAFYENLTTREFSLLEKAEIIKKLKGFGEEERKIIRFYLPLLGLPAANYYFKIYLKFSDFEPEFKVFIHEKNMSFHCLELSANFDSWERKLLIPWLRVVGHNKQKEILEYLHEISVRDGLIAKHLLNSKEIKEIANSKNLSPLQKANKLRLFLRKKRYPKLHSLQLAFNSWLKKISWPKQVEIDHTPYFESDELKVNFKFKNKQEFKNNLLKLQKVVNQEKFSEIFNLNLNEND